MKIRITSDLHCEFFPPERHKKHLAFALPVLDTDAETTLILAGDICNYSRKSSYESPLSILSPRFKHIIMVNGNHEYYGGFWKDSRINFLKYISQYSNIHYLDKSSIVIDGVAFIGAALWTNYNNDDPMAKNLSSRYMMDYSQIRNGDGTHTIPDTFYVEHKEDIEFLLSESKVHDDKPKVVITHHGISKDSIHWMYKSAGLSNYSFISELDYEIKEIGAKLWIHGHTHQRIDYNLWDTQVIANPLGYPRNDGTYENFEYDQQLVIEV